MHPLDRSSSKCGRGARLSRMYAGCGPNAAAACSRSSALLSLRRGCFGGGTATDVAPLISSTPRRRIRLRCFIRDHFVRPDITHFLATRALHSKAAGKLSKTGGFALAPQTMRSKHRRGCRTGVRQKSAFVPGPTRQLYPRLGGLVQIWVDGSQRGDDEDALHN